MIERYRTDTRLLPRRNAPSRFYPRADRREPLAPRRKPLSEVVAVACLFDGGVFGVGVSVCPTTGEMVLSQVAQDLDALMRAYDDLVNEAYAKFKDLLHNPDHVSAVMEFRAFPSGRAEEISVDLAPAHDLAGRSCAPAF
jgi:hypothetical protein